MTKEQYEKITQPLRENPTKAKQAAAVNRILTLSVFFLYPVYICWLFFTKNPQLIRAAIVPAVSFVLLTIIRAKINAKRPYEKFGLPPVIDKKTKGNSFPSRHVFSVFIIAVTVFYHFQPAGILLGVIGIGLGIVRVCTGVHEPRDVAAGAAAGILCGIIGYYLI